MFLATHCNKNNKTLRASSVALLVDFICGVFSGEMWWLSLDWKHNTHLASCSLPFLT